MNQRSVELELARGPAAPPSVLSRRRLFIVRAAWVVLAVSVIGLDLAGIPYAYEHSASLFTPEGTRELRELGMSREFYAAYNGAGLSTFVTLVFFAVAAVIFWRRSEDPMALFGSFTLLVFGGAAVTGTMHDLADAHPAFWFPVNLLDYVGQVTFSVFFYLFPDGRFVPRWTSWIALVTALLFVPATFFPYSPFNLFRGPFFIVFIGSLLFAQVYRYRRVSNPTQRQQTKWVVFGSVVALAGFSVIIALGLLVPAVREPGPLEELIRDTLIYGFILLIPLSIGMAILRYRLWDIDLVINHTLVYGALTAAVVGIYVLIVGYLGTLFQARGNLAISLVATGIVAVIFAPLRDRLQRSVNRLMYGERDDPYAVLSRLGRRLEATLAPEAVLPAVVEDIARTLRLPHVSIWLADDGTLRLGAAHGDLPLETTARDTGAVEALRSAPEGLRPVNLGPASEYGTMLDACGVELVLPLNHRGETVGALCVAARGPDEGFSPTDRLLLRDLATQSGAAAHAVRLTVELRSSLEEVRRSRERLVAAQEEERRRIQRDLHDGLGPVLASMRLRLEACLDMAEGTNAPLATNLNRLYELIGQATGDIRRLVYDLRPPILDHLGLIPALRQHCERFGQESSIEAGFETEPGLSIPAAAEVTLLRVVHEALLNVQKHAHASQVDVRLEQRGEWLELEIRDDGIGLEANGRGEGTGIGSMRERAELLGGTLRITGRPGTGTEIQLRIPVQEAKP